MIDFDRVRSQGGLAYGLSLAQAESRDLPIWTVPWVFLPTSEVNSESIGEASQSLGPMVLRWSDAKDEEFTSNVRRGDKHREIIRIPTNTSAAKLKTVAAGATTVMPRTAAGAVLQHALEVSSGCLADIEISNTTVEVELRTELARLLVRGVGGAREIETIGSDPRIPSLATVETLVGHLSTLASRLPSTTHGWHVEGVITTESSSFALLQLRPTPGDRPSITVSPPVSWAERTRYVWGVFDLVVDRLRSSAVDTNGRPVTTFVREHPADVLEPGAIAALEAGKPTLILDQARGFRLTHEPFNLPRADLRTLFYSVHLPQGLSSRFRVISDGDTAYFVEG